MTTEDRVDEYVRLTVEREILIADGVPEDDLLQPLCACALGAEPCAVHPGATR